jgi:serralysin
LRRFSAVGLRGDALVSSKEDFRMATNLTAGNDTYVADGGEVVNALQGDDQIDIIHTDDSDFLSLDFDYFDPGEVHGNQGDDTIESYAFGDRLHGDSGNDSLFGGGGRDQMFGGSGNDTIWTGTSEILAPAFDSLSALLDGDVVWAGDGDDTVHLENADNDDTIRGEGGYDILHLYNGEGLISQFSLIAGGSNSGLLASGFEELHYFGGAGSEVVEGGESYDFIYGGRGTDLISGNGAADWLAGEGGADLVNGGGGGDFIYGGDEDDILNGQDGGDLIEGGTGADRISDGKGDDYVYGQDGNDTIRTGEGADRVYGGIGNDVISEEGEDFTYRVTRDGTLLKAPGGGDELHGDAGDDSISGGTGHDKIYGESGNDKIDGGAGNDMADGGTGSDVVRGGDGDDQLFGNEDNDTLIGGEGADALNGGSGLDTADYSGAAVSVRAALDASAAGLGEAAGDTFMSVERLKGADIAGGVDRLTGDSADNTIHGNNGDDIVNGRSGNDMLIGGLGEDRLRGELGDDAFYYFSQAEGGDAILDFNSNIAGNNDVLRFRGTSFGGLAAGALAMNQFEANATGAATSAATRFVYGTDDETLSFDADGSGAGAATLIATLQNGAVLAIDDIAIF